VLQKPIERQVLEGVFVVNGGHAANGGATDARAAYARPPEAMPDRPDAHPA